MIEEKTLTALSYPMIIEQLKQKTVSALGKVKASQLKPSETYEIVHQQLQETEAVIRLFRYRKHLPLSQLHDIRPHLKRLGIEASLNGQEIAAIGQVLRTTSEVCRFFEQVKEEDIDIEALVTYHNRLQPIPELSGKIRQCIHEDGSVTDDASPLLRQLRFQIRQSEQQVKEKLDEIIRSSKSKYLSDAVVTMRNDRYVLPVKHEYKGQFGGVVHDESASGQTLFIEPKQVVELNNRRQQTKVAEKKEIERVLYELSAAIAPYITPIEENVQTLAILDVIQAKAMIAKEMNAIIPKLNREHHLLLKQARHPLLNQDTVVANDIYIGQTFKTLVITGPNTGGKTLILKTLGLLQLMGQSGFALPVMEGSEMTVFSQIAVDIGDEQSIEQNLSTFSAHMTNIISILNHCDEHSLLLFDELGAGTDPQEGAALAISILDYARKKGSIVMATTHYPELKLYGYNHIDTTNASMEFDVETLRPTYRLLIGTPGRSNAFDISYRLGLNKDIITHARQFIDDETHDVETSIRQLEEARQKMEDEYEVACQLVDEASALRNELKEKYDEFKQERHHLLKEAKKEANQVVQQAEQKANLIIDDLKEKQSQLSEHEVKEHELIDAKTQLKQLHYSEEEQHLQKNKVLQREKRKKALHQGDEVMVETYGQRGILLEKMKNGLWKVQIGMLQMALPEDELTLLKTSQQQQNEKVMTTVKKTQSSGLSTRLDLRGERYEEAMRQVEQYIDQAIVAGYPSVTIVHGKGTGALRQGIQKLLERHRQVKSFAYAPANSGGNGATIVTFK